MKQDIKCCATCKHYSLYSDHIGGPFCVSDDNVIWTTNIDGKRIKSQLGKDVHPLGVCCDWVRGDGNG